MTHYSGCRSIVGDQGTSDLEFGKLGLGYEVGGRLRAAGACVALLAWGIMPKYHDDCLSVWLFRQTMARRFCAGKGGTSVDDDLFLYIFFDAVVAFSLLSLSFFGGSGEGDFWYIHTLLSLMMN